MVGRKALEIEFLTGGAEKRTAVEKRVHPSSPGPTVSVTKGCRVMGLPRSTSSDARPVKADDAAIVAIITAICDEFEAYGYRRVGAEPRHRGIIVNCRRIRRLMREHGLQPKHYRRFVATTDSDHDSPIFPASPAAGSSMAQNSFGWRTPPTSPSRRALSIWRQFLTA